MIIARLVGGQSNLNAIDLKFEGWVEIPTVQRCDDSKVFLSDNYHLQWCHILITGGKKMLAQKIVRLTLSHGLLLLMLKYGAKTSKNHVQTRCVTYLMQLFLELCSQVAVSSRPSPITQFPLQVITQEVSFHREVATAHKPTVTLEITMTE